MAKGKNVAGVIGLGGGSSMDVAKLVAFLSNSECKQSMSDIYGVDACKGERLPLIQIPTTAGTGSEVTPISIVTTGASEKKGVVSPVLLPDWAIVDGELTLSLPAHVTAATGVDAMVHAIEAFTSRLKKNPLSDALAKEAEEFKPKMIICGASAYPADFDYARFRTICDSVGAYLMADVAHISGLIATGIMKSPFEHCDVVTSTTHKSLRGPRSGIIFHKA